MAVLWYGECRPVASARCHDAGREQGIRSRGALGASPSPRLPGNSPAMNPVAPPADPHIMLPAPRTGLPAALRPQTDARRDVLATLVVALILVGAMQVASFFVPPYVVPSPWSVLLATRELLLADEPHIAVTLIRLIAALAFAVVAGVALGLAMGMFSRISPYLRALVVIDTGIPALSWMLIAVFWFKDAELRIFFILVVILLPFYALNIYDAVRALSRDLVEMIESFRPSRWQVMRYLILPHVVPYVFLTTRSVIGYAIRMAIFAELVASAVGIGARMNLAQSTFRVDLVFAWTFVLVLLNVALQVWVAALEKVVLKWRPEVAVR
jgi:NitT/TauT family transport system permease protein